MTDGKNTGDVSTSPGITHSKPEQQEGTRTTCQTFQLSDRQRLDWLQLIRSENVGPVTFRDLINHFGSANQSLEALPELSGRGGKKSIKIFPAESARMELEAAAKLGIRYIGMGEPDYPEYLKMLDCPPPLLSVRGTLPLNSSPPIGMVGSRNSSLSGLKLATLFAGELGKNSYCMVSGFARGIDSATHRATLETGSIGVLAGGVNVVFPPENDRLYQEMLDKGNIFVSEMPLNHRPRAIDFPRRNRIIAGISLGVVIVEAAKRSGSLITARLANEAGRLVFAVPGSPLDPRNGGTNSLLKKGALVALEATDIIEAISPLSNQKQQNLFNSGQHSLEDGLSLDTHTHKPENHSISTPMTDVPQEKRQALLDALSPTPIEVDELVRHCQMPVSHVQLCLIELSLAGKIERCPGNRVSLIMNH